MRHSLRQSAADTPARGFEQYPKGSIVVCNACAMPVFKLDRSICFGDKVGASASAYKPLAMADLVDLSERDDIDAGVRATVKSWTLEQRHAHLRKLKEMRPGDEMRCPCCKDCFVQVLGTEKSEVLDRACTIELLTIPPKGVAVPAPLRGLRLGADHGWLHEHKVS